MNLYSDSIVDEPRQMLDANDAQWSKDEDQKKFSVCDGTLHTFKSPYTQEFSELLAKVPIDILKYTLMTNQQRLFAQSLWEAENYGGSEYKCIKHLKELYGNNWQKFTKQSDHMKPIRDYYEYVLILDHEMQWAKHLQSR